MSCKVNIKLLYCFIAFVFCLYFYSTDIFAEEIEEDTIIENESSEVKEPDIDPMDPMDSFAIENQDTIEDGDYFIQSALDENYVLDVSGGSKVNGGNVQIYEQNYTYAQGWNVSHDENGYVTFSSLNSNLALDVKAANTSNTTNIQQYESNETKAQKWIVVKEGGYYKIVSALDSNYVLDVNGEVAKNSQNVQLYQFDGSASQFWNFIKFETMRQHLDTMAKENADVLQDGQYSFQSDINTNYVVDVSGGSLKNGGNVQIYSSNHTDAQGWIVSHDVNGYVTLKNIKSGLVLDVASAKTTNGTNVQQYTSNNTYAQKWIVLKENGKYIFVSGLDSRMVLDINGGKAVNGQNIQIYKSNGTKAQAWHV
ncbi:MAG: RICIN domain-containing protein, partial [Floccifex sp.]